MSSFQPQQQQQQPVVVYPNSNPVTKQPASHHSNGSFGMVFVVLAIVAVMSAIACILGRFCNRRVLSKAQKPSRDHHHHNKHHHHNSSASSSSISRPKDQTQPSKDHHQGDNYGPNKERDIEFGFEMRSSSISTPNGEMRSSSISAPNGKPINNHNNSMKSGTRGHVAFERNGDPAKHHGVGGGDYHDYHGRPRASD